MRDNLVVVGVTYKTKLVVIEGFNKYEYFPGEDTIRSSPMFQSELIVVLTSLANERIAELSKEKGSLELGEQAFYREAKK